MLNSLRDILTVICCVTNVQVSIRDIQKKYHSLYTHQKWVVSLLYYFADRYMHEGKGRICTALLQNQNAIYTHIRKVEQEEDTKKLNQIKMIDNALQLVNKENRHNAN